VSDSFEDAIDAQAGFVSTSHGLEVKVRSTAAHRLVQQVFHKLPRIRHFHHSKGRTEQHATLPADRLRAAQVLIFGRLRQKSPASFGRANSKNGSPLAGRRIFSTWLDP
jgi:hypothetical protein